MKKLFFIVLLLISAITYAQPKGDFYQQLFNFEDGIRSSYDQTPNVVYDQGYKSLQYITGKNRSMVYFFQKDGVCVGVMQLFRNITLRDFREFAIPLANKIKKFNYVLISSTLDYDNSIVFVGQLVNIKFTYSNGNGIATAYVNE